MAGISETTTSQLLSSMTSNGGCSDSGDSMEIQEYDGVIDENENQHKQNERNKQPQQQEEVQQQHYAQNVYKEIPERIHNIRSETLECILNYQEQRLGFKTMDSLSSIYSSPHTFMGRINRILDKDFYTFVIDLSLLTKNLDELLKYCQHYESVSKCFVYEGDTINDYCNNNRGGSDDTIQFKLESGTINNKNIKKKKLVKKL